MAKQKSIVKIEGTLDDLTFYKRGNSYHVKTKGGVSADRIARDPSFARTRENGREFGLCAKSGKLLRQAFRSQLLRIRDTHLLPRVSKIMHALKKLDTISTRGERNVGVGIDQAGGKELLKGFDFNSGALLSALLSQNPVLDPATGIVSIPAFYPEEQLMAPGGATHFSLRCVWANIDFVHDIFDKTESNVENRSLDGLVNEIVLTPTSLPQGSGTDVFAILLEFFQETNGKQYPLQNGAHNALTIIEVL